MAGRILRIPEAYQGVADEILNAHAQGRHTDAGNHKLEHKDGDASGHAAGKGREPEEQDDAGLPCDAGAAVAEGVGAEALLLDRVDDEHAEAGEDERQPVDEFDVDVGSVLGRLGPDGGVEHDIEGEGELRNGGGAYVSWGSMIERSTPMSRSSLGQWSDGGRRGGALTRAPAP